MDFSREIYAGSIINEFREKLGIPDLTIGEVYAILRWNGIEPIRKEKRVGKGKSNIYPRYEVEGFLNNIYGIAYSKERILQNRRKEQDNGIYDDIMQDVKRRDLETAEQKPELTPYQQMLQASDELLRQQEVYFDDEYDDKLYEELFAKKVYFTEKQVAELQERLLLESDSRLKAVDRIIDNEFQGLLNPDDVVRGADYYVNGNPQTTWRQYLLYSLRHTFGLMANSDVKYLPLVAKLAFGNEVKFEKVNDNNIEVGLLQKIVMLLKKQPEVFQELNARRDTITFSQVYELLKPQIEAIEQADADSANQIQERNDYDIVEVPDFKTANYYGNHSCSQSKLCYTQSERTWNDYKGNKGQNRVYVCLKHGWENIPERPSEGNPYDEYGTSMIFVFISPDGDISTSNCRWNHETVGEYDGSVDHAFSKTTLAETVGRNFDATFKPYSREQLRQMGIIKFEEVPELLAQGVDPKDIFDFVWPFNEEGLASVELRGKYNFITSNNQLLCDRWFDRVGLFNEGYCRVDIDNQQSNYINSSGDYLLDEWVDSAGTFNNGFGVIMKNHRYNYVKQDGTLLSPNWFIEAEYFARKYAFVRTDFAYRPDSMNIVNKDGELTVPGGFTGKVGWLFGGDYLVIKKYDGKTNIINEDGNLVSKNLWFNNIFEGSQDSNIVEVYSNSKANWLNLNTGELIWKSNPEEWPFEVFPFTNHRAVFEMNNKMNYIDEEGNIISPDLWFDEAHRFDRVKPFAIVVIEDRINLIGLDGKLLFPGVWFNNYRHDRSNGAYQLLLNGKQYDVSDYGDLIDNATGEIIDPNTLRNTSNLAESKRKITLTESQWHYILNNGLKKK